MSTGDYHEDSRSTVYDMTRVLWDLTTDLGWAPGPLADWYVDMCPRGWNEDDDLSLLDEDWPYARMILAADSQDSCCHSGMYTDVTNEFSDQILH